MHGIAYDASHDEVVVPVALAAGVLVFRGGAKGAEAPLRVIQGPRTRMIRPQTVAVDEQNGEIIVGDTSARSVLVFPREAQGDVIPRREIHGPKTGLLNVVGVGVDPVHNLVAVTSVSRIGGKTGIFLFPRDADGDVPPRAVISGPKTGMLHPWQVAIDAEAGKIFVAVINMDYLPPYELDKVRASLKPDVQLPSPWGSENQGFIGVWDIHDDGDVPPRAVIQGPASGLIHPAGVAFSSRDGEVFASDSVKNGVFTFLVPEFFEASAKESAPRKKRNTGPNQ